MTKEKHSKTLLHEFVYILDNLNWSIHRAAIFLSEDPSLLTKILKYQRTPSRRILGKMAFFVHTQKQKM